MNSAQQKKVKKNLWVSPRQDKALKNLERITSLSQSEHIRRALDRYLENLELGGNESDSKAYKL